MRSSNYPKRPRDAITDAMGRLPLDTISPQWLFEGQKYSEPDISSALKNDLANGTVDHSALAQRIAASVPSHVIDGWTYLGRAVHCLVRGDTRTSVHLGYYAELRAALAIMAAEGIGIFNRHHFIIDKNMESQRLCRSASAPMESGTHSFIWPVYRWWYTQKTSSELVAEIIRPGGVSIGQWLNSANRQSIYLPASTGEWLRDWGIDLKRMNQDTKARNASSYGPSAIHNWQVIEGAAALDGVKSLWGLFRPHPSSSFHEFDRLLLHRILRTMFAGLSSRIEGSKGWHLDFRAFVDNLLEEQGMSQVSEDHRANWKEYFCTDKVEHANLLVSASRQSTAETESYPMELLSRAALLMRIATGSCSLHLTENGIGWERFEFWLDDIGVRRGFWEEGAYPENPTDLWTDVQEALQKLDDALPRGVTWRGSPHGPNSPLIGDSLNKLEECERIGLWGFGN